MIDEKKSWYVYQRDTVPTGRLFFNYTTSFLCIASHQNSDTITHKLSILISFEILNHELGHRHNRPDNVQTGRLFLLLHNKLCMYGQPSKQ